MAQTLKIRKGDTVQVMKGKDRGKQGRVLEANPKLGRILVENVNMIVRHQRPMMLRDTQRTQSTEGGVIEREGPIHISNVMLIDPKDKTPTRVRITRENGKRFRVATRSGQKLD